MRTSAVRGHNDDTSTVTMTYVVQPGDSLRTIAQAHGIGMNAIMEENGLDREDISVGERLRLPVHDPDVDGGTWPSALQGQQAGRAPSPTALRPPSAIPIIPRSAWAVQPIDLSNILPMGCVPWRITVHHSGDATALDANPISALRRIEREHKLGAGKNEPFACIGYHYVISPDGRIWEGRPIQYQGAHATGDNNIGNIGICLMGDFDVQRVPAAQRASLIKLLDWLCSTDHIPHDHVYGHDHFKNTDCPGRALKPIVAAYAASPASSG